MRILYATDLHGSKTKYEKLLKIAVEENIKCIVNGGDTLPKLGERHVEQPRFIKEYLKSYFDKLKENNITYLTILGNDDLKSLDNQFNELCDKYESVHNISSKKIAFGGFEFIGMDSILDHPFGCKDRVVIENNFISQLQLMPYALLSTATGYEKIFNWEEYALKNLPDMKNILKNLPVPNDYKKTIFIMHMPPANLRLGQLLHGNSDIGSAEISNFIEMKQPLLTLHGHIHEAPDVPSGKWINSIKETTCIQPGQTEFDSSILVYVDIDLDTMKFERKKI